MIRTIFLCLSVLACLLGSSGVWAGAAFETADSFVAQVYAETDNPRGLFLDQEGNLLVLATGSSNVLAFAQSDDGEVSQSVVLSAQGLGLNHALRVHDGYLYASSASTVYAWPYVPGTPVTAEPLPVVRNIPTGGHVTRTLVFDSESRLYVSVGSDQNVDGNSDRARIRRFDFSAGPPSTPFDFQDGEVFADGLRNEVGLAFDAAGVLWGVENGADQLNRPDLGGDIHNGNPAEELNKFDRPVGTHYGYPYCFSSHTLEGYASGTQFVWPSFMNDGLHSDDWCRNASNNQGPALAMPAHNAPLGIEFYDGRNCGESQGAFPCDFTGDAFVAFHGSWNSDTPVGYRVVRIPFTKAAPFQPTGQIEDIMYEPDPVGCRICFRPVNLVFNNEGHLIISADASDEIFRLTYTKAAN